MWETHVQRTHSQPGRSGYLKNRRRYELAPELDARPATEPPDGPTLDQLVARMKARWLRRVMYESTANSSQKCLAYAVFDHLNCVTLDCWPSQERLAKLLGFVSVKTVQRAARGLQNQALVTINGGGRDGYRYAPVFQPADEDNSVQSSGRSRPVSTDKFVSESFLRIQSTGPASTAADGGQGTGAGIGYQQSQRGAVELQIADRLGPGGIEILGKLSGLDDLIVERLCRAHVAGRLGERELNAARLAAEQVRS